MTYYNVVYRFGLERFASNLNEAKISGVILPDLPLIEASPWIDAATSNGRESILLAAPTTTDLHLQRICEETRGFVYAVGLLGITGARKELAESAKVIARRCKEMTEKPVLVGVGIGNPDQAMEVSEVSDGCIVGSAIVQKLLDGGGPEGVGKLVSEFRSALDSH
jgi:tryptophan synthase alpha chain